MNKYIFRIIIDEDVVDFEATIIIDKASIDYTITKDFGNLYTDMFLDILRGEFSIHYIENNELKHFFTDSKIDSISNIAEFCLISKKIFGFTSLLELCK